MEIDLKVKIVNERIMELGLPQYATPGSAGLDLHACIETSIILRPGERKLIPAGIALHMEHEEVVGLVFARSGLATKRGLALSNGVGVIDSDYVDEIKVGLINHSSEIQEVFPGDRIAQIVFLPILRANWVLSEQLETTERKGGFGSTGK